MRGMSCGSQAGCGARVAPPARPPRPPEEASDRSRAHSSAAPGRQRVARAASPRALRVREACESCDRHCEPSLQTLLQLTPRAQGTLRSCGRIGILLRVDRMPRLSRPTMPAACSDDVACYWCPRRRPVITRAGTSLMDPPSWIGKVRSHLLLTLAHPMNRLNRLNIAHKHSLAHGRDARDRIQP